MIAWDNRAWYAKSAQHNGLWRFSIRQIDEENWALTVESPRRVKKICRIFDTESHARDEAELLMDVFGLGETT